MSKTDLDLHPWAVAYFIDEEPEARYWGELLAQGHMPIPGLGAGDWVLDQGPRFGEGEMVARLDSSVRPT